MTTTEGAAVTPPPRTAADACRDLNASDPLGDPEVVVPEVLTPATRSV